jgi:hypothetical protein
VPPRKGGTFCFPGRLLLHRANPATAVGSNLQ